MAKTAKKSQKNVKNVGFGNYRYKKTWSKHCRRVYHLITQHYGREETYLGYRGIDRLLRVETQLIKDIWGYVDSVKLLSHRQSKARKERVRDLLTKYGRCSLEYFAPGTKAPDGYIRLNHGNVYLGNSRRIKMTAEEFLLHLVGDNFVSQADICDALVEWSGIPRSEIYDTYLDFVWFLKGQNEIMNMEAGCRSELPDDTTHSAEPRIEVKNFNNYTYNFY